MSEPQLVSTEVTHRSEAIATSPKVSIVILNWNSYQVTRECLLSLEKMDYTNYEVVLVDNGSVDGSPDRLAQDFPQIRVFKNGKNLGFTGGNNVGLRDALARGTDYLLLLNNDTIVAPNFLNELMRVTEREPAAGLANPKILYCEPADRIWYAGGAYKRGWSFAKHFGVRRIDKGQYDQAREVTFVTGCALLVKAAIAEKIGILDDTLFLGFEDLDWCVRARDAGFKAYYVPSAVIWHKEGYDTKKNLGKPVKDFYYVRNSILMARKHFRLWHWPYFLVSLGGYLAYRTAGYLVRREPVRVSAMYRGLWSGCTTKFGEYGGAEAAAKQK
jgi:GT2 family glycosyltransferase